MILTLNVVCLILALVCFLLAGLGVAWTRCNLIGAGLFFLTLTLTVK